MAKRRLARERSHQARDRQVGKLAHVPAILKFGQIFPQVAGADMDMRSVDAALHRSPKAFDAVRAGTLKADIFMGAMIVRHVAMPARMKAKVGAQFVGMDRAAGNDVRVDNRCQGSSALVRNNRRHQRRRRAPASP